MTNKALVVAMKFNRQNLRLLRDAFLPTGIQLWPLQHPQDSLPEGGYSGLILYDMDEQEHWGDVLEQLFRRRPGVRVVLISKFADERMWIDVLGAGAYDLLAKPIHTFELLRVVSGALNSATNQPGSTPPAPRSAGGIPCTM